MGRALCLILLSAVACGFGCASPYQADGLGGGFSETRLAEDVFRVNFRGNGYTSAERTQDFAILRAAELTIENGYKYFAVMDEQSSASVSTWTTPGHSETTGNAYVYGGRGSYQGTYSGQTTYTPPQTSYIVKPRSGLLIRCFKDKPEEGLVIDAAMARESIKAKYKIE